jgi:hypothetical protein
VLAGELHELSSGYAMQLRGAYDAASFRVEGFPGDPQEQDRRSPAYRGVLTRTADGIAGDIACTFTGWPIHLVGTRDGDGYALTGRLGDPPPAWRVPYLDDPAVVAEPSIGGHPRAAARTSTSRGKAIAKG